MRRRMAAFAAASLLLHAALLLLIQFTAVDPVVVTPEPVPVQFVDLQQPPPPAPDPEPPVPQPPQPPQEVPEQDQPPEIAPPPPPRPTPPPPEIPDEPAPQPEIPDQPAETPEIPAQEPAPPPQPATPPRDGAAFVAPEEDEPDDAPRASAGIPGIVYDGGRGSDLAWFGHAIECMDLDLRYEEYCADIGPIYVADNVERLAPEIEAEFRAMMARRNRYSGALDGTTGACDEQLEGDNLAARSCNGASPGTLRDLLRQIEDATD